MMAKPWSALSRIGNGASVSISTVSGPVARTALMPASVLGASAPGVLKRSQVKATSLAENWSPLWKTTSGRRWKVQTVGLVRSQEVASAGSISMRSFMCTRLS